MILEPGEGITGVSEGFNQLEGHLLIDHAGDGITLNRADVVDDFAPAPAQDDLAGESPGQLPCPGGETVSVDAHPTAGTVGQDSEPLLFLHRYNEKPLIYYAPPDGVTVKTEYQEPIDYQKDFRLFSSSRILGFY